MWFARARRRRRHVELEALHAALREADMEERAGVIVDPETQARTAEIRAKVAEWRASVRRDGYNG